MSKEFESVSPIWSLCADVAKWKLTLPNSNWLVLKAKPSQAVLCNANLFSLVLNGVLNY